MPSRADGTPGLVVLPGAVAPGEALDLTGDEAHYVARVCRVRPGEALAATDGRGLEARLRVLETRPAVRVRVEAADRRPRLREAWLLCGAPEGRRGDWLVEKLAELGVARLVAIDTERARWPGGPTRLDRSRRLAVGAMRQSRQPWLLEVAAPRPLGEVLGELPETAERWLADPDGRRPPAPPASGACVGAVGPAEGFSDRDRASLEARGFRSMSLSDGRLRCETAAMAWAAWWARGS
jgi:16S rRNA (uracil1498-N3)-methyltransferase